MKTVITLTLAAAVILGTLPAIAAKDQTQASLVPVVYSSSYGQWRQCADLTGMCGIGVG